MYLVLKVIYSWCTDLQNATFLVPVIYYLVLVVFWSVRSLSFICNQCCVLGLGPLKRISLGMNRETGTKADENKDSGDPLASNRGAVLMVCRACGKKGDHWTSRCPYKDLAQPTDSFIDKPPTEANAPASGTKGAYVPPSLRGGVPERSGTDMRRRNEENSVRVTNLSEDTREPDLLELFRPFGSVSRVYVAIDQKTGTSRGFGFVNFVNRDDAERAINKLNGYGYDNLILRVEWAAPRAN